MIQFATYDAQTGALVTDYTSLVESASFICNEHGFASTKAKIPLDLYDALYQYDRPGLQQVEFNENGSALWEGRLEDPTITTDGLEIVAMGYQRSLSDAKYTALWSTTSYDNWEIFKNDGIVITDVNEDKHHTDMKGRLYVSLLKNTAYRNNTDTIRFALRQPDKSNHLTVGIAFDYSVGLPAGWLFRFQTRNDDLTVNTNIFDVVATGGSQRGAVNTTFTGASVVSFAIFNTSGSDYTNPFDNGVWSIEIKNIRVVSSVVNRINTTLGTTITAGLRTVTPASMANIYVGQQIQIANGTAVGETVVVASLTASTFTATFANGHTSTDNVAAHVVYADEIVKDLITSVNAINNGALSSNVGLIQSPGRDITDIVFEDIRPSDVMKQLIGLGDSQTPPRVWAWQIWQDKILEFKPTGYNNRTWNVIISDIAISRRLDDIYNSYYPIYKDAYGRTIRGTTSTDQASTNKYGITRVNSVKADTKIATTANITRDTLLNYTKDPRPTIQIEFSAIFDQNGIPAQLTDPRPGDTLVLQNLPADIVGSLVDLIRSVVIAQTTYDPINDDLKIESDTPFPSIEFLLARANEIAEQPVPFLGYA